MQKKPTQKSISLAQFETFLDALGQHLSLSLSEALADGVRDVETPEVSATVAVDRASCFAAARWTTYSSTVVEHHETFFVHPSGPLARTGYRLRRRVLDLGPEPAELLPPAEPPHWWQELRCETQPEAGTIPTFLELLAVLCGRARVTTANPSLLARLNAQEDEANYLLTLLDEQKQRVKQYKARLRLLEAAATSASEAEDSGSTDAGVLTSLDDLAGWAADNHDRIVILPRALNGAKKSLYERPEVVCAALEFLAGPYRQSRLGERAADEVASTLAAKGLKLEGSVGQSIAGEHASEYFVRWDGRRRMLDLHLLKGGGRDERYCMRVYFFWDAESSRVVVGSMPAHLSNSLS